MGTKLYLFVTTVEAGSVEEADERFSELLANDGNPTPFEVTEEELRKVETSLPLCKTK